MLRAHATFFETEPDGLLLREHMSSATGFRLLRHFASGVYLIESDDTSFDTSAFSILETKKSPQIELIKSTLKSEQKAGRLEWGTYRLSDINDAIWLSEIFGTRVMIAYFDDDGGDMVAIARSGQLERACINGTSIDEEGEKSFEIEMLTPEAATYRKIERESWNDIFEREFKLNFGENSPDLTDEERPEFEEIDSAQTLKSNKAFLKRLVILATIIVAVVAMLHTRPSKPEIESPKDTQKTLEETCTSGDISANMQNICDEFKKLEQNRKFEDPK